MGNGVIILMESYTIIAKVEEGKSDSRTWPVTDVIKQANGS